MARRVRRRLKIKNIVIAVCLLLIVLGSLGYYLYSKSNAEKIKAINLAKVKGKYNEFVITNKVADIYIKDGDIYKKAGSIGEKVELPLTNQKIDNETKYFQIADFDTKSYISYDDIDKIDKLSTYSDRYKKYIPFNQNIVTNDKTSFYDEDDNLIYSFDETFDLPIIIKDTNRYGVEFNERLLYVKKDDVKETKDHHNTDLSNTSHIGALNYHFFWDDDTEPASKCDQIICHSKSQFKSHLELFKEMNLMTLTMKEAEMYIDGKVRLPKSVLITIDDGWRIELGIKMLNEYKMNATVFLVTGDYDPKDYQEGNDYVEFHSHSHKMHDGGQCPGGQGGGIKCLPRETILADLKASREKLNGSTVFCYPFYEYNEYSISLLKEAGFTMAFAGESSYLDNHIKVGSNKYTLPRFVIVTYTSMYDLKTFLN